MGEGINREGIKVIVQLYIVHVHVHVCALSLDNCVMTAAFIGIQKEVLAIIILP